jgi:hypothetical protein
MSKLNKFLTTLKMYTEVVDHLRDNGVDIDGLIGISNAQGPIAKVIHGVIVGAADSMTPRQQEQGTKALQRKTLPPKPNQKSIKKKNSS